MQNLLGIAVNRNMMGAAPALNQSISDGVKFLLPKIRIPSLFDHLIAHWMTVAVFQRSGLEV